MSRNEITALTDVALITCIVQRGIADTIVRAAQDAGAQGATDQIDRIFEKVYLAGKLDTPGMGLMYVTPLEQSEKTGHCHQRAIVVRKSYGGH